MRRERERDFVKFSDRPTSLTFHRSWPLLDRFWPFHGSFWAFSVLKKVTNAHITFKIGQVVTLYGQERWGTFDLERSNALERIMENTVNYEKSYRCFRSEIRRCTSIWILILVKNSYWYWLKLLLVHILVKNSLK